jgi:hypothetical protein
MEEGGKEAFCLLLWFSNGGRLTPTGKVDTRIQTRGLCSTPYDCSGCQLMQEEIARHQSGHAMWLCPTCVNDAVREAKTKSIPYLLPGHFTEGFCQYKSCTRAAMRLGKEEIQARFSAFLQLFIGALD